MGYCANCAAHAEDQCDRCGIWLCEKHAYARGRGDWVSEESYCFDCVDEHDDEE